MSSGMMGCDHDWRPWNREGERDSWWVGVQCATCHAISPSHAVLRFDQPFVMIAGDTADATGTLNLEAEAMADGVWVG